jgi:hypothetical protein
MGWGNYRATTVTGRLRASNEAGNPNRGSQQDV